MPQQKAGHFFLEVENIGGISHAEATFSPGVTILPGENATNRTSLLKALSAAQGNHNVSLKGDKSAGSVELTIDGETCVRKVYEKDGEIAFEGEYAIDSEHVELAQLFAFLFEDNEARRTIRNNEDLWEVVMKPVDTAEIERKIENSREERSAKETELAEVQSLQEQLPSLKQHQAELDDEIEGINEELANKRATVEEAEQELNEAERENRTLEEKVTERRKTESELERVESKFESTEQTIATLEENLEAKKTEFSELSSVDASELADVQNELETLHDRLAQKETMMSELQSIIQFNRDMIEDTAGDNPLSVLSSGSESSASDDNITEQLIDEENIVCWTCGTKTSEAQIANTVDQLQTIHEDIYGEREYLRERIEEYKEQKRNLEEAQERQEELEGAIADLESQLERNEKALKTLDEQQDELSTEVQRLDEEIAALRKDHENEILEVREEIQNLEIDLRQTEEKRQSVTEEIEMIEDEVEHIDTLETEIKTLTQQIEDLKQRVSQIEQEVVDHFNENMDTVLDTLDYDNIERIWIDRRKVDVREGRRTVEKTRFDLHVIRESEDGTTYEDTIDHLSESEREVTGLVFTLAGYLVFEVYEKVPFMILDSLEAIDSRRIALLLDFFRTHADNIAVALLEEDAAELDASYNKVVGL